MHSRCFARRAVFPRKPGQYFFEPLVLCSVGTLRQVFVLGSPRVYPLTQLIVSVSFGSYVSFRWKDKFCRDGEVGSCCLGHSDILVMNGQCQDEFLHCTDPGLEKERINVTFRWIRQHTPSCPLRAGVVCCLPPCAQGSSATVMGNCSLESLCIWRVLALLGFPLMSTVLGLRRCAYHWTRPSGGGRWGHSLRDSRGAFWVAHECSQFFQGHGSTPVDVMPYLLAFEGCR